MCVCVSVRVCVCACACVLCACVWIRLGFVCPADYNYADFYINTLSIAPGEEEESRARVKVLQQEQH